MKIAIYPGTFDPITNGHLSILERAVLLFDKVIIGIAASDSDKKSLFSINERKKFIECCTKNIKNIKIEIFSGLLMNFVKNKKAGFILRGLRAVSDFEYEFQLALLNKKLSKKVETVFLLSSLEYIYLSSTMIKQISNLNGNIKGLVPRIVEDALRNKFKSE